MKKAFGSFLSALFVFTSIQLTAQDYNPIPVAMPSLLFAPDARGGGMGDIGAAKYPFTGRHAGVSFSYPPWLSKLVNDMHLLYAAGYWKPGNDETTPGNAFAADIAGYHAAYLVSTAQSNPMDQTLRISLGFDMDGIRNILR